MTNSKKKYFHETYFKKIQKLSEEFRLIEAINEFQKYLAIYPKDLDGYVFFADALIKANKLEEAEDILKHAENFMETQDYTNSSKEDYDLIKIKLLSRQEKYHESYELVKKNIDVLYKRRRSVTTLLLFLKLKLGLLNEKDIL